MSDYMLHFNNFHLILTFHNLCLKMQQMSADRTALKDINKRKCLCELQNKNSTNARRKNSFEEIKDNPHLWDCAYSKETHFSVTEALKLMQSTSMDVKT